ncbi:calcium-binding protein [Acidovorax sp. RAC01]|uniref:calcium-binding protein n=1 Tax=Acidovorax sp. RAC01 TaxID=1842533 RepID=UPI00083E6EC2|nr:calcium-binding protein [Acidovorax sp. RAC01]AOG23099.1 EF-hand domain pair family protein [Acidovorax sp. RAC01]
MKAMQRRTYAFDTRSVMLFAALSLGGAAALHAQTTPSSPSTSQTEKTRQPSGSGTAPAAPDAKAGAAASFDRADTNKDGKLSVQEAARLPVIAQRFQQLDADKDGSLSRTEFEKALDS